MSEIVIGIIQILILQIFLNQILFKADIKFVLILYLCNIIISVILILYLCNM